MLSSSFSNLFPVLSALTLRSLLTNLVSVCSSPFVVFHIVALVIVFKVVFAKGQVTVDAITLSIPIADGAGRQPPEIESSVKLKSAMVKGARRRRRDG